MMGISWGGFNSLQVAALRPPALKAVISFTSTVDRYNDDIHYKNGCHLSAQLSWAATMLGYQSRVSRPRHRRRSLEGYVAAALGERAILHGGDGCNISDRDDFWRHGSICENSADVAIPALVIAGWADGYRNTPLMAVEGLGDAAKALMGPWSINIAHFAWPKPRADFHGEAIARLESLAS